MGTGLGTKGIVLLALFSAGFSACLDSASRGRGANRTEQTYIKAVYSAPVTLDPAQMDDTASLIAANLIYDGLLSFDSNLEIRAALAESWSASADGRTFHFHLKGSARFHDGTPVTSSDVIASLRRLIAPASKVSSYYDCIEGATEYHAGRAQDVTGIRARSASDIDIHLKNAFPPFLSVLAGGTAKVLPASADTIPDFFKHPIGSGAFKYEGTVSIPGGTDTLFDRFDGYTGENPKLARIALRAVSEEEARREAKAGIVQDLANWPLTGKEEVFETGQHLEAPLAATWVIGLNTRLAPFNQLSTRQFFRDSLDVEAFRTKFYPDAVPARGYIPPGLPGFQGYGPVPKHHEATVTVSRVPIQVAFPAGLAQGAEMRAFLERSFREKGWDVHVVEMPWDQLMKGYAEKTLQAFLVAMNMDYPDTEFLVRNFESTNPDNFSGIHDPGIDKLIHQARATCDRVRRQAIYGELVARLHDLAPTIDLFHPRTHLWVGPCVRGIKPNILADVYIDYREVNLDPTCTSKREVATR